MKVVCLLAAVVLLAACGTEKNNERSANVQSEDVTAVSAEDKEAAEAERLQALAALESEKTALQDQIAKAESDSEKAQDQESNIAAIISNGTDINQKIQAMIAIVTDFDLKELGIDEALLQSVKDAALAGDFDKVKELLIGVVGKLSVQIDELRAELDKVNIKIDKLI